MRLVIRVEKGKVEALLFNADVSSLFIEEILTALYLQYIDYLKNRNIHLSDIFSIYGLHVECFMTWNLNGPKIDNPSAFGNITDYCIWSGL